MSDSANHIIGHAPPQSMPFLPSCPDPRPLFDEPALFDALAEQLLPSLIERRRGNGNRLRLWSAACADGAEPYALAILLHRLVPDPVGWQLGILGSDGDRRWFPQPRRPLFEDAAVTRLPSALRQQCFRRAGGAHWTLTGGLRRMVEFGHVDLLHDGVPSLLNNTHALDLIVCRGLLPGLAAEQAAEVVGKLVRALAPDGCLLVDRAPAASWAGSLEISPLARCWLIRRGPAAAVAGTASTAAPSAEVDPETVLARALADYRHGRYCEARLVLQHAARLVARPARMFALLARIEAVEGRVDDARAWAELAVSADDLDPSSHCLRACILQVQGAFGEAMQAFQRALYLDPGFMLAHYGLGGLARRLGRYGEAERHLANALSLARSWPADAPLPHADGLSAGRLAEIVAAMQGHGED